MSQVLCQVFPQEDREVKYGRDRVLPAMLCINFGVRVPALMLSPPSACSTERTLWNGRTTAPAGSRLTFTTADRSAWRCAFVLFVYRFALRVRVS